MIRFDEALKTVLAAAQPLTEREEVALDTCVGRVLALPIVADRPIPPYDRVAVDGYACRRSDLPGPLTVIETVAAGAMPQKKIEPRTCIRVMTGGVLPTGADMVVMVEDTVETTPNTVQVTRGSQQTNIAHRGEDAAAGETLVPSGTRLAEKHLATLASVGAVRPVVWRRPHAAIVSTGDEVVLPEEQPLDHQIRNSNGPMLAALCRRAGAEVAFMTLVPDRLAELEATIGAALERSDAVILSGGVSKGNFDLVPEAVKQLGGKILFDTVAIKPGRPTTFALIGEKALFCLPGNPVSVFVAFELFVRPFLDRTSGVAGAPADLVFPIGGRFERRSGERDEWIPATIRNGRAHPLPYHGSGHFHALTNADCLIRIPAGVVAVATGETIRARLV